MSAVPPLKNWQNLLEMTEDDDVTYHIAPADVERPVCWGQAVRNALDSPIDAPPLRELAGSGTRVVILVDDATRPTPQNELVPPLLDALNDAGVKDENITAIVALGTHRYMSRSEMRRRFGLDVCRRVNVFNHTWRDESSLRSLQSSGIDTPLRLNRLALEADLLIGTGSIVPHIWAGWGGGAKILLPGISSSESIAPTHALAEHEGDLTAVVGRTQNACRSRIEQVAEQAGLDLVLNCVVDASGQAGWVGAGHPVQVHRSGIAAAREIFCRGIPRQTDIVLADARPAVKDYWQGIKALAHSARGTVADGSIVLVGTMHDGVAPTHPEFIRHARRSPEEIADLVANGGISDPVIVTTLRLHAILRDRYDVICLAEGLNQADVEALGFRYAASASEALRLAREMAGTHASVGIINYAGDVLPVLSRLSGSR
jgi:nickel-dependent lactate racemase